MVTIADQGAALLVNGPAGGAGWPSVSERKFMEKFFGRMAVIAIGYFEGLESERAIAWRAADSLSLRAFLGYALDEATPDHSTISRTRRLYWVETHKAIFRWVSGF
jgi:hypothetical protein